MNEEFEFVKKYNKKLFKIASKMYPEVDKDELQDVIDKLSKKNVQNPVVTIDNNYTGERKDINLLTLFDWIDKRKPIIAGNGTFYKNQNEAFNPIGEMLDGFLTDRKMYKKKMFSYDDPNSSGYRYYDLMQTNTKKSTNSYYGASGMKSSAFYSVWSAPATTGTAQSGISTAEQTFEAFLADNYIFISSTEALEWCEVVHKEFKNYDYIDEFIEFHTIGEVVERIYEKILNPTIFDHDIIERYFTGMSDEELAFFYYKNNIFDFIGDHQFIQDYIIKIFSNVENLNYVDTKDENWFSKIPEKYVGVFNGSSAKDWNSFVNKQYFMDPNEVPESIADIVDELKTYLMKYVYVRYLSSDRIYRLKNFKRQVVTVIDTDSNILSLDTVVNYIFDKVICDNDFDRDLEKNHYICINILAYVITAVSNDIFLFYGEKSNVPEEFRPRYNMKNEFLFTRLVIGNAKKRYISTVTLREGNLMDPPKYDVKGFDFKKSTCTDYAEKKYLGFIKKYILCDGDINISGLLKDLYIFKEEILESIKRGETNFIPNATVKDPAAYSDPATQQGLRGAVTWNLLNPNNMIEFPAKVNLLKLRTEKLEDLEELRDTHPEEYNVIKEKIFNDNTGMFVIYKQVEPDRFPEYLDPGLEDQYGENWVKQIPAKVLNTAKKFCKGVAPTNSVEEWNKYVKNFTNAGCVLPKKENGFTIISIPVTEDIPDWLIPYIDYNTVLNDIFAPFNPLLEIFNIKKLKEGKKSQNLNRESERFTNIVKF